MITGIICLIDAYMRMFTAKGFIASFDFAYCAAGIEIIITIVLIGCYDIYKGFNL